MPRTKSKPKEEELENMEFQITDDEASVDFNQLDEVPDRTSAKWSDHVLSELAPDEKIDNYPKADGLKRLVQLFLGPIIESTTDLKNFPTFGADGHSQNTSTAVVTIKIADRELNTITTFSAVADASCYSVQDEPFNHHLSAIAETRAEARVYRKALGLKNVVSVDELSKEKKSNLPSTPVGTATPLDDKDDKDMIQHTQKVWLKKECQSLDINLRTFVNTGLGREVSELDKCTRNEARALGDSLSQFKKKKNDVPDTLKGFDAADVERFS